jgi:hypothetical protein
VNRISDNLYLAPMLALLCALRPPFALASPPETSFRQLLDCRQIAANAARLACFDRTSAELARTGEPPPAAGPQGTTRAMKEALDPQRTFGLPHAAIVQREAAAAGVHVKSASDITARIVGMGHDPDGRAILSLDNGQVWEQLVADGTDLYTKAGDTVRISRGWLDSYWLETPSHHGCKVTRLR